MRLIKLVPEKLQGAGWVRAILANCEIAPGPQRCMVERPGHRDAYLSHDGWRGSVHFVDVELVAGPVDGEMYFLFRPEVVQHMSASANYQLSFVDHNGAAIDMCTMTWKGVPSYRLPMGSASGIAASPAISGDSATSVTEPIPPAVTPDPIETPDAVNPFAEWSTAVPVVPEIQPEIVFNPPEVSEPEPAAPVVSGPVFKIDCPHGASSPLGPHKIFSNTMFCPICSKPV